MKIWDKTSISYIELNGDTTKNPEAFMAVVRAMHDKDMSYFSVNHANDFCPMCHTTAIIDDECPVCGYKEAYDEQVINLSKK